MSPSIEHKNASSFFPNSPISGNNPWYEIDTLAVRAGVSTDHLCSLVEDAIKYSRGGQSSNSNLAYQDDLDCVAHFLVNEDPEVETKVNWNESEHPRDERGRFANASGGTNVHEEDDFTPQALPHVDPTQALKELHGIHNQVSLLYPKLTSRWKGVLKIKPKSEFNAAGSKSWQCNISVAQEMFAHPARRVCVMIHESLHSLSPTTILQYANAPNWEEGAVEGAVRVHRSEILRQLGTKISQSYFDDRDRSHPYNKYVNALEDIRRALGIGDIAGFYDELMSLPADQIESHLLSKASQLSGQEKAKFPRRFAVAKAILEDRFKP